MTLDETPAECLSLRDRMRQDSADQHRALDTRLSQCDLHDPDGLARFLKATEYGLAPMAATRAPTAPLVADLVIRLRDDLATLDQAPLAPAAALPDDVSPWAVDYVVLGSRLGTAFLARHWQSATHPDVLAANRYLTAPAQPDAWRDFCRQTRDMSPKDATADRAVDDIRDLFKVFYAGTVLVASDFTVHADSLPPEKNI